ncbi:MAG: tetratricopeptide repeat protein [Nitrospira sp.]
MNLRYLLLVSTLVTACVFSSCSSAGESQEVKDYKVQCDRGDAIGCFNLGTMYENGDGVKQSDTGALNYYGKACDLKDEDGCEHYARMKKR